MNIENKFNIGQTVRIIHDKDRESRMITAFQIIGTDHRVQYSLGFGSSTSWHYEFEITDEVIEKTKTNGFMLAEVSQ